MALLDLRCLIDIKCYAQKNFSSLFIQIILVQCLLRARHCIRMENKSRHVLCPYFELWSRPEVCYLTRNDTIKCKAITVKNDRNETYIIQIMRLCLDQIRKGFPEVKVEMRF